MTRIESILEFCNQIMNLVTWNRAYREQCCVNKICFFSLINPGGSHTKVFLRKSVLKICSKFTEHPCRSVISIKLQRNFIEIALRHGRSLVNLLHIFRTPFPRNTSGWLLLINSTPSIINIEYIIFMHTQCIFYKQSNLFVSFTSLSTSR